MPSVVRYRVDHVQAVYKTRQAFLLNHLRRTCRQSSSRMKIVEKQQRRVVRLVQQLGLTHRDARGLGALPVNPDRNVLAILGILQKRKAT